MPLDHDTLTRVQRLILDDPELQSRLRDSTDANLAIAEIVKSAGALGVAVSAAELRAHADEADPVTVSDAELDALAGGERPLGQTGYQLLSLFTLGQGCDIHEYRLDPS